MLLMIKANVYDFINAKIYIVGNKGIQKALYQTVAVDKIPDAVPASLPPQIPSTIEITTSIGMVTSEAANFWHYKVCFCIDTHNFQCIYLFTYPHITQFTCDLTAYYTCQHNTYKRRGKLKYHRIPYNLCNSFFWYYRAYHLISCLHCTYSTNKNRDDR